MRAVADNEENTEDDEDAGEPDVNSGLLRGYMRIKSLQCDVCLISHEKGPAATHGDY